MQPKRGDQLSIIRALADESRDGVILFDGEGRVLHQNATATALLSEADLRAELKAALETTCVAVLCTHERQQFNLNGLAMAAAALPSAENTQPIGVLTMWSRSALPSGVDLRARFGFTAREVDVALLLAERRTDAEIASALGISWHTVRSHIERIFSVLGCHTRRDAAARLRHHD